MPSLGDLISSFLSREVEVLLKIDQVVFRSGGKTESLEPFIYLSVPPGSRRVLAVGGSPSFTEPFECIHLFDSEPLKGFDLKKHEILEAFLRYGFAKVHNRLTLVRPRVVLFGTRTIAKAFGGYEQGVLTQAALTAGAREVVINLEEEAG